MTKKTDDLDAEEVLEERVVNTDLLYSKLHFSTTSIAAGRLTQELPAWELGVSQVIEQGGYRVVNTYVSQAVVETGNGKENVFTFIVTMQRD